MVLICYLDMSTIQFCSSVTIFPVWEVVTSDFTCKNLPIWNSILDINTSVRFCIAVNTDTPVYIVRIVWVLNSPFSKSSWVNVWNDTSQMINSCTRNVDFIFLILFNMVCPYYSKWCNNLLVLIKLLKVLFVCYCNLSSIRCLLCCQRCNRITVRSFQICSRIYFDFELIWNVINHEITVFQSYIVWECVSCFKIELTFTIFGMID